MLDIKLLRTNFEEIKKNIDLRNKNYPALEKFQVIDKKWREVATKLQNLNTERNTLSEQIGNLIKEGRQDEISGIKEKVQGIKVEAEALQSQATEIQKELEQTMFSIPNILDISVPFGKDENENVEIRKNITPTKFDFTPKAHWEIGVEKGLLDFERGVKIAGSRMYFLTGEGAILMRALRNFTLDTHIEAGYTEVLPPIIMNAEPYYGLGKLPLFEEDMYQTIDRQFLSGTEEHPLTSMYMNETLETLPVKVTSSIVSFRKEAGSAGKDTKGILRVHQFYNTELVNFVNPSESFEKLEEMTHQAEKILKLLEIPYRTILLCSGDTGDAATKTYDIEVWVPSENKYREISSCSNVLDYQSRALGIKYKDADGTTKYVHTLNGTGTSLNRLWIAIVENFQQADGTILIPEKLQKYMNNRKSI
ncbi:MAG: serine--tRNA ligase [Mycoplasmataceae bacterium]|nr:serine--tRNA ligase [Mycoplasmataceae bacterium]